MKKECFVGLEEFLIFVLLKLLSRNRDFRFIAANKKSNKKIPGLPLIVRRLVVATMTYYICYTLQLLHILRMSQLYLKSSRAKRCF